ncbi:MAG: 4-hydroxy-tetrahydrodipicolinate reductase [Chitinophagaceae bacterium]|nr:4-hydroxy-tetrahydrodipicolinate reductase [Chitinophagaceae bacterium]
MKIALIGYGKMGKAIEQIAIQQGHEIVLKIGSSNLSELNSGNIEKADVAIEFSKPEVAFENVVFCLNNDTPVVCGTTGWIEKLPEAEKLCIVKNGSFLYASNFSIGVNIFFEINKRLAKLMSDRKEYNVEIEETHHIHKKDAPSGTAISLAREIIEEGKKKKWVKVQSNSAEDLFIKSIRTGEVPGTHVVTYSSENDAIEIKHTAHNRMGFAAGAVASAQFIKNKTGIFTMKDVLGL